MKKILLPWEKQEYITTAGGVLHIRRLNVKDDQWGARLCRAYENIYEYTLYLSVSEKVIHEVTNFVSEEAAKKFVDDKLIELGHKLLEKHMLVLI